MRAATLLLVFAVWASPAAAVGPHPWTPIQDVPAYERAVGHIKREEWREAITALNTLRREHDQSADLWNWLGFAHRKLKDYPAASEFYARALALDPSHRGALEYQGELFIETNDLAAARANLDRLTRLCGDCEEQRELAEAITKAAP